MAQHETLKTAQTIELKACHYCGREFNAYPNTRIALCFVCYFSLPAMFIRHL